MPSWQSIAVEMRAGGAKLREISAAVNVSESRVCEVLNPQRMARRTAYKRLWRQGKQQDQESQATPRFTARARIRGCLTRVTADTPEEAAALLARMQG